MIIDALIPLLLQRGQDVTTKQIAQNASIAEGTLFRAFADKESMIVAAVAKFLDPEPVSTLLRAISPDDPIERKIHDVLSILCTRYEGIFAMLAAVGTPSGAPVTDALTQLADQIEALLSGQDAILRVDARRVGYFVMLLAFASSVPAFHGSRSFTTDELTDLVLNGILAPITEETDYASAPPCSIPPSARPVDLGCRPLSNPPIDRLAVSADPQRRNHRPRRGDW